MKIKYFEGKWYFFDVTGEDLRIVLQSLSTSPSTRTIPEKQDTPPLILDQDVSNKIVARAIRLFPKEKWNLLFHINGERRSTNDEHAHYFMFESRRTKSLRGLMISKNVKRIIKFGLREEETSMIATITRAVESMPFKESFTRRALTEVLPSNLSRPENLKVALEYLRRRGIISETTGKDHKGITKTFIRIKEKGDSPSKQSDQDAAGAILR